jgi:selenocysteine-specific elongation factor
MRVIGTAGHVDHGKSSLIHALTGIDPDRLVEEKSRQMTIDLGYAWLKLPSGETIGIVDVPGHQDFIENMLAGAGSIDAALLIVAADEGLMPQTYEHIAILDLLHINQVIVVLTKIDLAQDTEWISLIESDIRQTIQATAFANAPFLHVSARTGQGIAQLVTAITEITEMPPVALPGHTPYLHIDRVFTLHGHGTIVTGTLRGGQLSLGEEVEILPQGIRARIRGLQSYNDAMQTVFSGSRVAVNLAGISKDQLARGNVLTTPSHFKSTQLVDGYVHYLPQNHKPLLHNTEVRCFIGTAETTAYARILGKDELAPGEKGWVQLRLNEPIATQKGERFILRQPSPSITVGGGEIVNPYPSKRWKRFDPTVIADLKAQRDSSPIERIIQFAQGDQPITRTQLQQQLGLPLNQLDQLISEALATNQLIIVSSNTYISQISIQSLAEQMHRHLTHFHQLYPMRLGIDREELRSKLKLNMLVFNALEETSSFITRERNLIRLSNHQVSFTQQQMMRIDSLRAMFAENPFTPPSYTQSAAIVGEDVLRTLIDMREIIQVQSDVIFSRNAYETMHNTALTIIDKKSTVAVSDLRDAHNTSRKYAIALLEHLDAIGITKRQGDLRVRSARSSSE